MLIIFNLVTINLNNISSFECRNNKLIFYIPEIQECWFEFDNPERAKKSYDRIIYAYAKEYRILDLTYHEKEEE